jgi:hypothetical protein
MKPNAALHQPGEQNRQALKRILTKYWAIAKNGFAFPV